MKYYLFYCDTFYETLDCFVATRDANSHILFRDWKKYSYLACEMTRLQIEDYIETRRHDRNNNHLHIVPVQDVKVFLAELKLKQI
jgi:hypothetical protein